MNTVLLIEDEEPIRNMVRFALSREGIDMLEAEDGATARRQLADRLPHLILLDWMLPDTSGLDLLRDLGKDRRTATIPVIMLTARAEEEDKIRALDAGADDYITKPFSPKELIARINAVIRRATGSDVDGQLSLGSLVVDTTSHQVSCNGEEISMGPTEFRLLQFFLSHPERVYSRSQLLDNVWSNASAVEERTVDVHIRRLRKALAPWMCENMIQTVRGTGYRMTAGGVSA